MLPRYRNIDLGTFGSLDCPSPPKVEGAKNLCWRLDPEESLSDWKIIITEANENATPPIPHHQHRKKKQKLELNCHAKTETYNVHKNQIGVGKRYSEYFARMFRNAHVVENRTSTSRITLDPSAAEAFPVMLDFLYSHGSPVDATTKNAVALRYLSNYFGISDLFDSVNIFIKWDMTILTAPVYLEEASRFSDEKMMNCATEMCAKFFSFIDTKMLLDLPPHLFKDIMSSAELTCDSEVLSARVVKYLRAWPQMGDDSEFLRLLTHSKKMPSIDPDSACFLMKLSLDIMPDASTAGAGDAHSLYDRCMTAISSNWDDCPRIGRKRKSPGDHGDYDAIPVDVKVELLESALRAARKEKRDYEKKYRHIIGVPEGRRKRHDDDDSAGYCVLM